MYVLDLIKICIMNTTFSCSVVSLYLTPPIFYTDLSVLKKRIVERLGGRPPPLAPPWLRPCILLRESKALYYRQLQNILAMAICLFLNCLSDNLSKL